MSVCQFCDNDAIVRVNDADVCQVHLDNAFQHLAKLRTVAERAGVILGPPKTEETELLHEWMTWWAADDRAPAKMPNALHIRTAIRLQLAGYDLPAVIASIQS